MSRNTDPRDVSSAAALVDLRRIERPFGAGELVTGPDSDRAVAADQWQSGHTD